MKFRLYIVDSNEESFDKAEASYFDVRNHAIDFYEADTLGDLLLELLKGINEDKCSDQNWYFITDEENGIIIKQSLKFYE